jgi:fluoroacetyl-CoA thioesterase
VRSIPPSTRASHLITVTDAMTVDFEQPDPGLGRLHRVYATYWMAKHFELVSRKLTLPFLEEHDEGIGFELSVRHLAPALPGMKVELEARLQRVEGNRVFVACRAVSSLGDLIGEGSTTQVILSKDALARRFARLRHRIGP